jgi:starvation-inducible DNA-binding protein
MPKEAATQAKEKHHAMYEIPTDLNRAGVVEVTTALRQLLADAFALYLKTKNFHWHMIGRHFRDYHLLLDEHSEPIFAMTDDIAERARKIGGTTLRSIGDISRHHRLEDNNDESVPQKEMLAELSANNQALTRYFRAAHEQINPRMGGEFGNNPVELRADKYRSNALFVELPRLVLKAPIWFSQ